MSTKRKIFTAEFKTKVVLEVLQGEKTLNEIASNLYYTPIENKHKISLKEKINNIYENRRV